MNEDECIIYEKKITKEQTQFETKTKNKQFAADVRVKRMSEQTSDAHVRDLQSKKK